MTERSPPVSTGDGHGEGVQVAGPGPGRGDSWPRRPTEVVGTHSLQPLRPRRGPDDGPNGVDDHDMPTGAGVN